MAFDFPSGVYFYYSVNEQAFFPLENVINLLISVNDTVLGIKKKSCSLFMEIRNYILHLAQAKTTIPYSV